MTTVSLLSKNPQQQSQKEYIVIMKIFKQHLIPYGLQLTHVCLEHNTAARASVFIIIMCS